MDSKVEKDNSSSEEEHEPESTEAKCGTSYTDRFPIPQRKMLKGLQFVIEMITLNKDVDNDKEVELEDLGTRKVLERMPHTKFGRFEEAKEICRKRTLKESFAKEAEEPEEKEFEEIVKKKKKTINKKKVKQSNEPRRSAKGDSE